MSPRSINSARKRVNIFLKLLHDADFLNSGKMVPDEKPTAKPKLRQKDDLMILLQTDTFEIKPQLTAFSRTPKVYSFHPLSS